jgi:hypothetical protein
MAAALNGYKNEIRNYCTFNLLCMLGESALFLLEKPFATFKRLVLIYKDETVNFLKMERETDLKLGKPSGPHQPANREANQSISQFINQSINQSVLERAKLLDVGPVNTKIFNQHPLLKVGGGEGSPAPSSLCPGLTPHAAPSCHPRSRVSSHVLDVAAVSLLPRPGPVLQSWQ